MMCFMVMKRALQADGGNRRPLATLMKCGRTNFAEAVRRIPPAPGRAR